MDNEIKNVKLSFCCEKDWSSMRSVDEQKKFCDSCQHKVVDFTSANSNALATAMQGNTRLCGRFKRSQISESFLKYAASVMVVSSVAISCAPIEEPIKSEETALPIVETELEDTFLTGVVVYDSAEMEAWKNGRETDHSALEQIINVKE